VRREEEEGFLSVTTLRGDVTLPKERGGREREAGEAHLSPRIKGEKRGKYPKRGSSGLPQKKGGEAA